MLSHTRNRQSRWIKVATAPMAKAKPPMAKAKPEVKAKPNSQSQTHSVSISNSLRQHVKRHKSLIRNANWTNKTMYSVSIVTYNGIRTTLLYILSLYYNYPYGHCHSPLWRLFVVFTDRVLGRSLCERS